VGGLTLRHLPVREGDARRAILDRAARWLCVLASIVVWGSCGGQPASPSSVDPIRQVVPLESSGPIRITFASANIPPGSTVAGCGALIEGCANRLHLSFVLNPPSSGPVLYARVYMHATNLQACLWGEIAPFTVNAGGPMTIEIPADRTDQCRVPTDIATMAVVVEGPIEIASSQTWSVRYTFMP
jgi:hypothetical protein